MPTPKCAKARAFSERLSQRWKLSPRGGHFAALEQRERLLEDIRTFSHRFDRSGARPRGAR